MNDRELLELAAKAAGIEIEWHIMINSSRHPIVAPKTQREKEWLGHEYTEWDPLADDGDALRLAVRLGLSVKHGIEIWDDSQKMAAYAYFGDFGECHFVHHSDDPYAATRRAIVLAAAEIGRAMS